MNKTQTTTDKMLEKYCSDKEHAAEVAKYAVMIFDALNESVCKFSDREKEYLVQAAKLHDIGYFVGKKSHHKHSMKMILDEGLEGYSKEEIAIIANIARYHRGSLPDESRHECYAALSDEDKQTVSGLAAILKIADGLDKPHKNLILRMRAVQTDKAIELYMKTIGFKPNLKMAEKKKDLFETVFKRPLLFLFE